MHYRKLDCACAAQRVRPSLAALVGALALAAAAHDIPTDVKIKAFVKPEGQRLELLIRVPLAAMIEVDFPTRGPGYLDLARADEALRHAAKLYLIDNIDALRRRRARCRRRASSTRAFRCLRPLVRVLRAARAHVAGPPLAGRPRALLEPAAARRAARISDPLRPLRVLDRSARGPARAATSSTALRFLPPGGADARLRVPRRSRPRAARPALASGRVALRRVGLLAHPRRHRPPALPAAAW